MRRNFALRHVSPEDRVPLDLWPVPPHGMTSRTLGLVALALVLSWLSGHALLVWPAQRALAQAQDTLLVAQRDELAKEYKSTREQKTVERLKAKVATMLSDAQRMRDAEAAAKAELVRFDETRRPDWLLPGQHARTL